MTFSNFLASIGQEVFDAEEESFLLFSQDIPSTNLGFVDPRAPVVDVTVRDRDYEIQQSPTLLSSSRAGGTTGAVLWKINPAFAEWIASPDNTNTNTNTTNSNDKTKKPLSNPLWNHNIITPTSPIIELGCGISALVPLALGPHVGHYLATDQEYVRRLFWENVAGNVHVAYSGRGRGRGRGQGGRKDTKEKEKGGRSKVSAGSSGGGSGGGKRQKQKNGYGTANSDTNATADSIMNISFVPLDWETDMASLSLKDYSVGCTNGTEKHKEREKEKEKDKGFDLLISCDCIYNEALITPFLRTCADICRLRPVYHDDNDNNNNDNNNNNNISDDPDSAIKPTTCIIAQQLRSPDVFETWLREAMREFRVWRVCDEALLGGGLRSGTGYVVHLLVLRG